MTEADARGWLDADVPRETMLKLHRLVDMVLAENLRQNLIAKSTEASIWNRHVLDSAQLLRPGTAPEQCWLDVGTGAGFPGLVLAILSQSRHVLVEPRQRRAEFLRRASADFGIAGRVRVVQSTVEKFEHPSFDAITARAVATIDKLLVATAHLSGPSTTWILSKGRRAATEIAEARVVWNACFETSASITDPDALIVRVSKMSGRMTGRRS